MIILVVRPRTWLIGVSVVDSFEFCSLYFSDNVIGKVSCLRS